MEESLIYPLPNRAWIDVNVGALRRNALALTHRTGLPLIPMIKADAYGVGAAGVVAALEPLEPLAYGVASVEEGEILRHLGLKRPIIVFTPILEADYPRANSADLTPSLGDAQSILAWSKYGKPYQ
ncbi:MAG: alanine racemase, partial [Gemmatimonadaceae bacterium]